MNDAATWSRTARLRLGVGACLSILGLAVGGCETMSSPTSASSDGPGPAASPRQYRLLQNIPVPNGFELVRDRSTAWASGQIRWASCEFEGGSNPERVADFYTRQMPSARFTLKKESLENGESHLRFESDTEECNIRVRQSKMRTKLLINVGPLPKGTAERKPVSKGQRP